LTPQTFDFTLAALHGVYRPTLNTGLAQNNAVQLPTSQLVGGQRVATDLSTFNASVAQNIPWWGGAFSLGWNNRRQESSNAFNTFNPQYNSTLTAILTQPLLRGRSTDPNRSQLIVTSLNRDISEVQLRATITNTVAAVRNAYWELAYARAAVKVFRQSLELAEKLVEDNKTRVEIGTMAEIDIIQAQSEAAARRQTLVQAEAQVSTADLTLKRLIVGGTEDPLWKPQLVPSDRPVFQPAPVDLESAIRNALDKRTDLVEIRKQLQINDTTLTLLHNQTLPAADVTATYGLQGIGGTQFIRGSGLGSPIIATVPGGYGDALSALTGRDFPSWSLQLNISYPLGKSTAEAAYARARVQRSQSVAESKALELQVATEVTNAALQVSSNTTAYQAAAAARELAQKRLEAEESKFEVGMSTNFFVVQAQRDLADAQTTELRTLLDYAKSVVEFERSQEASLSNGGITLVSGASGSAIGSGRPVTTTTTGGGTGGGTGTSN
jgi:outer membrane protein TolC